MQQFFIIRRIFRYSLSLKVLKNPQYKKGVLTHILEVCLPGRNWSKKFSTLLTNTEVNSPINNG